MLRCLGGSAVSLLCLLLVSPPPVFARARDVTIVEVPSSGVPGTVREVRIRLPENPARRRGRTIAVTAWVLAAEHSPARPDPILVFQGGPGQSATELASFYARFFAALRRDRDIVLFDQRGTGRSSPLRARVDPAHLYDDLGSTVPATWVAPTLAALRDSADLTQYTTRRIVDDAVALLDALGCRRADLYGTSYGTRCVLDFLRRHPRRVRAAVIKNVMPPRALIPLSYAANSQRALELLLADVAADSAAHAAFPRLGAELDAVLRRLQATPVRVTLPDLPPLELGRNGVAMTVRNLLMSPASRARIPRLIERAAEDSFADLATEMAALRAAYAKALALGMSLSVVASEDVPRLTPEAIAADTAGTFLRDAALAAFVNACRDWPRARVDPGAFAPVKSRAPVLVVSGRLDPATPPAWGEEVCRDLPNGRHVIFAHAGHPNSGFEGLDDLVTRFVTAGSARGLDLSVAGRGATPPFELPER